MDKLIKFFENLLTRLQSSKTTVIGIVVLIAGALALTGFITPEKAESLGENFQFLYENIEGIASALIGIFLVFSKDSVMFKE